MILVVDDDFVMAECIARAVTKTGRSVKLVGDGLSAMDAINQELPELIFLDVLLDGPDGFTLLNELISYPDTAAIPVVIVTSLTLEYSDLSCYGIVGILEKDTMKPQDLQEYIYKYTKAPTHE